MGSALEQYLLEQRAKAIQPPTKLPSDLDKPGPRESRLALEHLSTYIPLASRPFFQSMGVKGNSFADLPPGVQAELGKVQPAVDKLPENFDYQRLAAIAEGGKDKLKPEMYFKLASVAAIGQARKDALTTKKAAGFLATAGGEAVRQASFGLINVGPAAKEKKALVDMVAVPDQEELALSPQGQAIAKAVGGIAGIALSGKLVVSALSKVTLLPKLGPMILQLPQRTREIMLGVGTGAILDAARPDGLPEDPAAIDITARMAHPIAKFLGDSEAAQRTALGISGGAVGGVLGELLAPIFRGIQNAREASMVRKLDPATMTLIRDELGKIGIGVVKGETNQAVVAKLLRNMDKIGQSDRLAAITAADETRMDYVLSHLYSDPAFKGTSDLRYMAGVFRANPGGLTIARDVEHTPAAAEALAKQMGLNVVSMKAGKDVLIMRPQVVFPEQGKLGAKLKNQLADFTDQVRALGRGKPSTRMAIMGDGTVVRGDYSAAELTSRYKLAVPSVEETAMHDVALREHLGLMDVKVGEGGTVTVNLPSTVTKRQVAVLGKMADRGIPQITLNSATPGLSITMDQPFGMQVEDAMSNLVRGATKPKITADVVKKVQQYQKEGVFQGQAAVLPDGYPVEVMRKIGKKVLYKDPITGLLHRTPEENIAILPTSLEGELLPSRQIFEVMDPLEQKAFARLRQGINEGLTKPITTVRELESFAAARGKLVSNLGKGKVRIFDPNTGESQTFDGIRSAVTSVRGTLGPLPDLTPPEIEELLGYKPNIGGMNGGPPARFGESIPITEDEFTKAMDGKTLGMLPPGAVEQFFTPTKGLMANLSKKYGMPFDKVFDNLQSGTVHRQNFVSTWIHGEGPGIPKDVMPLAKIYKMAGKPDEGRQRVFTAWLESEGDDVTRKGLEAGMTSAEIKAAGELRKWYGIGPENGLFKALDVDAAFLTDYAPHLREHSEGMGNDIVEAWRLSRGTPLPKSVEFFADYARDGSVSVYEDRAFVAAAKYVEAGARSRFLNSAMDDAKRLLRAIPDNAVKAPLANYIEALRGSEFTSQRASADASFSNLLHSLGANEKLSRDVGERLTLGLLGLSYQSTMAFRPGLAVRNAAQIFQTTWPLLGDMSDNFAEAIGRALTVEGRNAAIRAGAITVKQNAVFAGEDVTAMMPKWLQKSNELGFKLYDTADGFTRSVSFHTAKLKSEKAIAAFGKALTSGKNIEAAQRTLIKDSGAMVLSKSFTDEFLRRVATSPESAAEFMGKQMADVTQFLYGRGNQPRWMRSVPGRFFGQFGTWPLWYVDYVKRSFTNMWSNGYQTEAVKFLGKIALVDAAIYEAGRRSNLDLRRWMAGNALFGVPPLGQPPAVNALYGVAQLSRGLSEAVLGTYDSPANKQRMANAEMTLRQSGAAFIPNMYAVRDIGRLLNANNPTEVAAVLLATRPSSDFTVQQKLDMLFAPGRLSTDIDLEYGGDATPTAVELMIRGMRTEKQKLVVPTGNLPAQPPGLTPPPGGQPSETSTFKIKAGVSGRPPLESTALPQSIRTGESKPIP